MSDSRQHARIEPTDARQGEKSGVVRYVLAASLTLVIVAFAILYIVG